MQPPWPQVVSAMLRPLQPRLAQCRARATAAAEHDSRSAERQAKALASCRERIEAARSRVFETGTGVVGAHMTALEHEWLALARPPLPATERALALWNELAPPRWKDRVRFASTDDAGADRATLLALASDPDGVERAEAAALRLAGALRGWNVTVAASTSWCPGAAPGAVLHAALASPLQATSGAMHATYGGAARVERAAQFAAGVRATAENEPALAVWPLLVDDLVLAAQLDFLWQACVVEQRVVPPNLPHSGIAFGDLDSPVTALVDVWTTGFFPCAIGPAGVSLGALPV